MVRHTCNSSSWEAEAGGPAVLCQPGLHREFQVSINYTSIASGEKGKKGEKGFQEPGELRVERAVSTRGRDP